MRDRCPALAACRRCTWRCRSWLSPCSSLDGPFAALLLRLPARPQKLGRRGAGAPGLITPLVQPPDLEPADPIVPDVTHDAAMDAACPRRHHLLPVLERHVVDRQSRLELGCLIGPEPGVEALGVDVEALAVAPVVSRAPSVDPGGAAAVIAPG